VSGPIIDCPEVKGKIIQSLKLYPESEGGCEAVVEFTDGTAFSCCISHKPAIKAQLYRPGVGGTEVLVEHEN